MMMRLFKRRTEDPAAPTSKVDYPYGLFICTEAGFFLIREGCRLRLKSERVMASWSAPIVLSSEAAVKHLPVLRTIGFRDGTLVRDFVSRKVYLISRNKKRLIASPDVYTSYGLNRELIIEASQEEVNLHEDGEVLS